MLQTPSLGKSHFQETKADITTYSDKLTYLIGSTVAEKHYKRQLSVIFCLRVLTIRVF